METSIIIAICTAVATVISIITLLSKQFDKIGKRFDKVDTEIKEVRKEIADVKTDVTLVKFVLNAWGLPTHKKDEEKEN